MGNRSGGTDDAAARPDAQPSGEALPWRVPLDPAPWWAWALFVVPFLAVPALNSWLWMGARDFLAVGLFTLIGASVVRVAGGVVLYRVEITETALKARTSLLVRSLAWQDVDEIEIVDDAVVLTSGKDENEINGIATGQAAHAAAVMQAAREAAGARPVRRSRPRPGIGVVFVLSYLVLAVGAFLIRWQLV
ncbi:hypothetical protein [Kribbella sp. NPDC023855]|uniref:hypothetical protein n=1 Tax=Kribbella sp. NPDC023855 TaxID=3154698 RepID=UPI0033E5ABDE